MRRALNVAVSLTRLAAALCLLVVGLVFGNVLTIAFACVEAWMCGLSLVNCVKAEVLDESSIGLLVPLLYLAGVVLVPVRTGPTSAWLVAGELVACGFRVWAVASLWTGYTCGAPTWLGLCDRGPYRWIRHPQALAGVVARCVFVAANPCAVNALGLLPFVGACLLSALVEERFLSQFSSWRSYRDRVGSRWIPGVV